MPISDVVGLKTDRLNAGRTAVVVGAGVVTWIAVAFALAIVSVGAGG